MKLKIKNNIYPNKDKNNDIEFTKIVKTKNSIICYINNEGVCTYEGITNFDLFEVEGGEFTIEHDKPQTNEILLKQLAALTLENNKKDSIAKSLMKQVAEINLKIMKLEGAK